MGEVIFESIDLGLPPGSLDPELMKIGGDWSYRTVSLYAAHRLDFDMDDRVDCVDMSSPGHIWRSAKEGVIEDDDDGS